MASTAWIRISFAPNPIRTISVVFGINWQIRIRISSFRKLSLFERFEFLVCSKFNHTQCGRTGACVVACLCPHNSISNVVVSVTIHDNKKTNYRSEGFPRTRKTKKGPVRAIVEGGPVSVGAFFFLSFLLSFFLSFTQIRALKSRFS